MGKANSLEIQQILAEFHGKEFTEETRREIAKKLIPALGSFDDHIEKTESVDPKTGAINLTLKAKTFLGHMLLEKLSAGAPETSR